MAWVNPSIVDPQKPVLTSDCWKRAYSRGIGTSVHFCTNGFELHGALCYPVCQDGYQGVITDCYQKCPVGWRNDGHYCYKPDSYLRSSYDTL